jgi:hypothetical protein
VACATNDVGDLHICAVDNDRGLWHTIRLAGDEHHLPCADGSWPIGFGNVLATTRAAVPSVCADLAKQEQILSNLEQHVFDPQRKAELARELEGIRAAELQHNCVQPARIVDVACAHGTGGSLHVCGVDPTGRLWHTARIRVGEWSAFEDVEARTGPAGSQGDMMPFAACAAEQTIGELHVCVIA